MEYRKEGDKLFKLVEVDDHATSNRDHFESDVRQIIEHYQMILSKKAMNKFFKNVLRYID